MKRLISAILLVVLLVTIFSSGVFATGYYYEPMVTSQYMIDIIKDFEGFSALPYGDGVQWSIGYGTYCGRTEADVPQEYWNGITEAQAEEMLRDYLAEIAEVELNTYYKSLKVQPTQQQFDAMVDFTYNLGGSWMDNNADIKSLLLTEELGQAGELALVNELGQWCRIGDEVSEQLCSRRIREALIYLHGEYYLPTGNVFSWLPVVDDADLPRYRYVIYDGNGVILTDRGHEQTVQYFFTGDDYESLLMPDSMGNTFAGWYLADGTSLLNEDLVEDHVRVKADWIQSPISHLLDNQWYASAVNASQTNLETVTENAAVIPNAETIRTMFKACFTAWQVGLKLRIRELF